MKDTDARAAITRAARAFPDGVPSFLLLLWLFASSDATTYMCFVLL